MAEQRLNRAISFNSRTPGGVRLFCTHAFVLHLRFNSRTPGGVRRQRVA